MMVWLLPLTAHAQAGKSVTLEQAVSQAFERHPQLRKIRARQQLGHAFVEAAGVYPFNPVLTFDANARIGDQTTFDFQVGLEQELELAGQRGLRVEAATLDVDAVTLWAERMMLEVAAQVRWAFVDAVAQRELFTIAQAELEISKQLLNLAERRLVAGAGTQLEIAVAGAELSKSEEQVNSAAGEYAIARSELAYAIGLEAGMLPEPVGGIAKDVPEASMTLAQLMEAATKNRQDLLSLHKTQVAAKKRIELARAQAWPNLTLGVFAGQEAGAETLVGGAVSMPLPFFQRNQGGIAVAEAELIDAEAETAMTEQNVLRDVATAFQQFNASRQSLQSLQKSVVSTDEALHLLRRAFETGKNNWVEILVMRRTLFDAQRALVKITASTHHARIKLDVATGSTTIPTGLLFKAGKQ